MLLISLCFKALSGTETGINAYPHMVYHQAVDLIIQSSNNIKKCYILLNTKCSSIKNLVKFSESPKAVTCVSFVFVLIKS